MGNIREFLSQEFLLRRNGLEEPDGRLLHLYNCEDEDFWRLVDLLQKSGAPNGHDFERYLERWRKFREELLSAGREPRFDIFQTTDLDWTIRGFVLYASGFWLRFRNEEWRRRSFPDGLPFEKLTWLQFLSLVDWTELYRKDIAGYVELEGTRYRVAHASKRHADASGWDRAGDAAGRSDRRRTDGTGHYPGLYFPMLAAWDWWKVAPVRLPSSIRYLDTFAHQGGAQDRLVIECSVAFESESQVVYKPVKPPNGYGIAFLPIQKEALPKGADASELNVTLLFGSHDESSEE